MRLWKTKDEQLDVVRTIQNELTRYAPHVSVAPGAIGIDSIMLCVAFSPKDQWNYGYIENSNYARVYFGSDGELEMFVYSVKAPASVKALPKKLRKSTVKSVDAAVVKLKTFITDVMFAYTD